MKSAAVMEHQRCLEAGGHQTTVTNASALMKSTKQLGSTKKNATTNHAHLLMKTLALPTVDHSWQLMTAAA